MASSIPVAGPPQPAPKTGEPKMADYFAELEIAIRDLERAIAGYTTLVRVHETVSGAAEPGHEKGMLLSFKGSMDGMHVKEIAIDVGKDIDASKYDVPYVIMALVDTQARAMAREIIRVSTLDVKLQKMIAASLETDETVPAAPEARADDF